MTDNTLPSPTDEQINALRNIRHHPATVAWGQEVRRILASPAPLQAEPVPVVASEPDGEVISANYECAVVKWAKPSDDPDNAWSWPIAGTKVYLSAPLASESEPVAAEKARDFEAWWRTDGQFVRAGGGDYEKCFAFAAWKAALASQSTPPAESAGLTDAATDLLACLQEAFDAIGPRLLSDTFGHEWVEKAEAAMLAATPTAKPDGGSKA